MDMTGYAWVVIAIGLALAGLAMAYGMWRGRRLTRSEKHAQQRAAHENFRRESE